MAADGETILSFAIWYCWLMVNRASRIPSYAAGS